LPDARQTPEITRVRELLLSRDSKVRLPDGREVESLVQLGPWSGDAWGESQSGVEREPPKPAEGYSVISGRVTDPDKIPIAYMPVEVDRMRAPRVVTQRPDGSFVTYLTDEKGRYALMISGEGDTRVSVLPAGDSPFSGGLSAQVAVEPGEVIENVDVMLVYGKTFAGYVIDEVQKPLKGMRVDATVRESDDRMRRQTTTDERGYFELRGLPMVGAFDSMLIQGQGYETILDTQLSYEESPKTYVMKPSVQATIMARIGATGEPAKEEVDSHLISLGTSRPVNRGARRYLAGSFQNGPTAMDVPQEGYWRVALTMKGKDGRESSGSAEFHHTAAAPAHVEVDLWPTQSAGATVRIGDIGGPPLVGGIVRMATDSKVGEASSGSVDEFGRHFLEATTDAEGAFRFDAVGPGKYMIDLRHPEYVFYEPQQFVVLPEGKVAQDVYVAMRGGAFYGSVMDDDGNPAKGWTVMAEEPRSRSLGQPRDYSVTVDEQGFFRIVGLPACNMWLRVNTAEGRIRLTEPYPLGPGEEREVNFDFSGRVLVRAHVTLNGEPAFGKVRSIFFWYEDEPYFDVVRVAEDSSLEVRLIPGMVEMTVSSPNTIGRPHSLRIAPEPKSQVIDLPLHTVDALLLVEFPEGKPAFSGQLILAHPGVTHLVSPTIVRMPVTQEVRRIPNLLAGVYRASLVTNDDAWTGTTEVVEVGPGRENFFHLKMQRLATSVQVGAWSEGELPTGDYATLRFDVSEAMLGMGTNLVANLVARPTGNAVAVRAVRLVQGQSVLAQDTHPGLLGKDKWGPLYRLTVPAGVAGTVTLEAELRGDGGSDTSGTIHLAPAQ